MRLAPRKFLNVILVHEVVQFMELTNAIEMVARNGFLWGAYMQGLRGAVTLEA